MTEPNDAPPFSLSGPDDYRTRVFEKIPDSYSPALHLAGTVGVGLLAVAAGAWRIADLRAIELLAIPVMLILSNGVEWRAHKDLLHKRRVPLHELYDRHTPQHHRVFRYEDMAIRAPKELKLVLIPAVGVLAVVIAALPMAALAGYLFGANVGWLVLMTSAFYVVSYELTHMIYHLSEDSFIGGLGIVRVLREHHARHHDPRLMHKWNFNVTLPLFDWLHGTIAKPHEVERARARARTAEPQST